MPRAPTAKSLLAVPTVGTQWHQKRVHQKLDDRDSVLAEAVQLVEEWDAAVFPYVVKVNGWDAAAQSVAGTGNIVLVLTCAGPTLVGATVSALLGGKAGTVVINSATQMTITWTGGLAGFGTVPAADDMLMLYVRVDNVLMPVPALAPCVA
jgi:hypothetical protein